MSPFGSGHKKYIYTRETFIFISFNLQVSACSFHNASWRMPLGYFFVLSKYKVDDMLQCYFWKSSGGGSQGKNHHGRFVVDNISCVRYIWCGVGNNPPNHVAFLDIFHHFPPKKVVLKREETTLLFWCNLTSWSPISSKKWRKIILLGIIIYISIYIYIPPNAKWENGQSMAPIKENAILL